MLKDAIKLCKCSNCDCVVTFTSDESAVDCPDCLKTIDTAEIPATWDDLDTYLRSHANG
jgi:uncharacterized paraquat-inducible protein A